MLGDNRRRGGAKEVEKILVWS